MTPERWRRVEPLYHAARAKPPSQRASFLADACRDDDALRRDVESLLNEPDSDDGFLSGPAFAMAGQMTPDQAGTVMPGRSMGVYQLETLLGAGGMGEVYRARDTKLGRDVAIKILPRAFTSSPDRLARFEREARMLAALNHPNICAIYGLEEADGIRFLILELVEGETLARKLDDVAALNSQVFGLPIGEALAFARQIADALEVAHEKGIIHRDLKPANIMYNPTTQVAKLLDFGIARDSEVDAEERLTRAGFFVGTLQYVAPEALSGELVNEQADVYSLATIAYYLLSGTLPFTGKSPRELFQQLLSQSPVALNQATKGLKFTPAVEAAIMCGLERELPKRCRTVDEFARSFCTAVREEKKKGGFLSGLFKK